MPTCVPFFPISVCPARSSKGLAPAQWHSVWARVRAARARGMAEWHTSTLHLHPTVVQYRSVLGVGPALGDPWRVSWLLAAGCQLQKEKSAGQRRCLCAGPRRPDYCNTVVCVYRPTPVHLHGTMVQL